MQGRFNLNNLARLGEDQKTEDPQPLEQFQRLLVAVGLEAKWAGIARDWIDPDDVTSPEGAEDQVYTSQNPPYRAGNWPMISPTELMNMPGFTADAASAVCFSSVTGRTSPSRSSTSDNQPVDRRSGW